jgi:hypothetical protein
MAQDHPSGAGDVGALERLTGRPGVEKLKPAPSLRSRMATKQMGARTMSRRPLALPPARLGVAVARVLVSIGARTSLKPISCADWAHTEALRPSLWPGFKGRLGPLSSGWGSADDQWRGDAGPRRARPERDLRGLVIRQLAEARMARIVRSAALRPVTSR